MLTSSVTNFSALRQGGVCEGTLSYQIKPKDSLVAVHAVLTGTTLECFDSQAAFLRRDMPTGLYMVVGASAWTKPQYNNNHGSNTCLQVVTNQGTLVYLWTATEPCRDVWLQALQAGLELSLMQPELAVPVQAPPKPEQEEAPKRTFLFQRAPSTTFCRNCCRSTTAAYNSKSTSTLSSSSTAAVTASSGSTSNSTTSSCTAAVSPLPQYGLEGRQLVCASCATAQGLFQYMQWLSSVQASQASASDAIRAARQACEGILRKHAPPMSASESTETPAADVDAAQDTASSHTPATDDTDDAPQGTGQGSSEDKQEMTAVDDATDDSAAASSAHASSTVTWAVDPAQSWWVRVPPTPAALHALTDLLQSSQFGVWSRQANVLADLGNKFTSGHTSLEEFMEDLLQASGCISPDVAMAAQLKKQAFGVAGDVGTAMKLLTEQALPPTTINDATTFVDTDVLKCVLEFFLNLIENGELTSVAFFWPQLCHIHLRMLPPRNAASVARVELYEDFLLTVATRYSIHLALELVWSHTADLEESLQVSTSSSESKTGGPKEAPAESTAISPTCRRRRFAVLRFICELESVLFDLDGGWGGGTVCLGQMLLPSPHQAELLKQTANRINELRIAANDVEETGQCSRLTKSARFDLQSASRSKLPPEDQAKEKLRLAKNADYFSCHLNFSKRLADIAEKLRFMDLPDRGPFLEQELDLLNASGSMGGDPLNRIREDLVKVIRVPSTEGHVFRSKERTPVLMLMEVIDELAEDLDESDLATMEPKASEEGEIDIEPDATDTQCQTSGEITENPISSVAAEPQDEDEIQERASSPTPDTLSSLGKETLLEGAQNSPAHPKALKRLPISTPTTPKHDVKQIVNTVATEQLRDLIMPDIDDSVPPEPAEDVECLVDEETKVSSPQADELAVAVALVAEVQQPSANSSLNNDSTYTTKTTKERRKPTKSSLGSLMSASSQEVGDSTNTLAPTGDIRRAVLTTIMMRGLQGNTIAAGASISVQRSLQELERKRATELLLSGDDDAEQESEDDKTESSRRKLVALGLCESLEEAEMAARPSEEDEILEAIRLMLIQNQVANGKLTPSDAAKVLQHTSLSPTNVRQNTKTFSERTDPSDHPTIDAGDVDSRLVGCGPLPPAVLHAMTLWKADMVSNAELLELVKKDIAFVKHSVLVDAENLDMLKENSAFWGRFAFGERWAEKKSRIASSSPQGGVDGWDMMGVIVKSNDDLRQEAFVMQLIELCQEAFELASLELWISPYRILATGRTTGVIECVRNAMSFDALKKRPGYGKGGLRQHLQRMTEYTADPGSTFKTAQQNFVRSLAAYSLLSYFFLFKDRHNGNLLLDTAGHVIHIDFGFVFGTAPGGSFSLESSTPFKLTEEMLDVMGGLRSPLFSEFVTLFCCGFLALQSYCDTFLTLVQITSSESTFNCFEGQQTEEIVGKLRERFCPDLSKEDTVSFALDLIKQATTSYGTRNYDLYQYLSQGIVA